MPTTTPEPHNRRPAPRRPPTRTPDLTPLQAWRANSANAWLRPGARAVATLDLPRLTGTYEATGVVQQVGDLHPEDAPRRVHLRPVGGGREFTAPVEDVRPA